MQIITQSNADNIICNAHIILSEIPTIKDILNLYKEILYKCSRSDFIPDSGYKRNITYFSGNFTLCWDVNELLKISKKSNSILAETKLLYKLVDKNNILENNLYKNNNSPVLLATIPFITQNYIPVDGNHRIVTSYILKKPYVNTIILDVYEHTKAMTPHSQKVFKVCYNLYLYNAFIKNIITPRQLKEFLFKF